MTLFCPRCRTGLQERPAHELLIQGCVRCGGVWLDRNGMARLGEALSSKTLAAVDVLTSEASREEDTTRPIDCPLCAEILIRTLVLAAGVAIDRCPDHGAWYDRNELQRVARALGTAPVAPDRSAQQKPAQQKPAQQKPAQQTAQQKPAQQKPAQQKKSEPTAKKAPPKQAVETPRAENAAAKPSGDTASGILVGVAEIIVEVALSFF